MPAVDRWVLTLILLTWRIMPADDRWDLSIDAVVFCDDVT